MQDADEDIKDHKQKVLLSDFLDLEDTDQVEGRD